MINCLFTNNDVTGPPPAEEGSCVIRVFTEDVGGTSLDACFVNNTVASNAVRGISLFEWPATGVALSVANAILWGNGPGPPMIPSPSILNSTASPGSELAVTHTDSEQDLTSYGTNNVSVDPDLDGHFRLNPTSPLIDIGSNMQWILAQDQDRLYVPCTDKNEDPRIVLIPPSLFKRIDMGCYEVPKP